MKNIIKISIYSLLFSFALASCNEDSFNQVVEFDVPKEPSRLVVNCVYTIGDDSLVVLVGKSRNVGDSIYNQLISNAKVELFKNGTKLFDVPFYPKGTVYAYASVYQLDKIAAQMTEGATYTIKVSAPGFEAVESEQKTPPKPVLSAPFFKSNGFTDNSLDGGGQKLELAQFDLSDPSEENFYTIGLHLVGKDSVTNKIYSNSSYHTIDPQFTQGIFDDTYGSRHTITDATFNGKKVAFKMGAYNSTDVYDDINNTNVKNLKIVGFKADVYSVTKEKYLYDASIAARDGFSAVFGEPIVINSNIQKGYGLFAIRNKATIDIPIK